MYIFRSSLGNMVPSYRSMSRGFIHREGGHQGFCQQKDVDDVTRLLDPEIFDGIVQLCLYDSWCHVKSALLFFAILWAGTVCCVFACDCSNCAWITMFFWHRVCKSASCFCHNATISFAFFFCRASNYSLNPCTTEISSMVVNLNTELPVATIYS